MKSLPRGLVAALTASVAVHLAAIGVPWRGTQGGEPRGANVPTLLARLIEAPAPPDPLPSRPIPAAAEPEPAAAAIAVPMPDAAALPAPSPPQAAEPATRPATTPAPVAAASSSVDRGADPTKPPAPTAVRSGGDSQAAGLDRGPRPLDDIDPVFPVAAGHRGGTVTLRLVISEQGEVESIAVVQAVPPGLFDEAALAAFGRARFAPGLRAGVPVRSEVLYEVEFAPLGRGSDSSGRTY